MPKAQFFNNRRLSSLSCLVVCIALVVIGCTGATAGKKGGGLTWTAINTAIEQGFPRVPRVTTTELVAMLESDSTVAPILLDIREPEEFKVSHLPGALPASTLSQAMEALRGIDKNHPIVAYCSVGYRSGALAKELQEKGYTSVFNLQGSIFQWANEGRPVFADSVRVYSVHPYDDTWGRLLDQHLWPESFQNSR